jgi:predicted nucleotidyltransferase component of viral defense system
MPVSDLQRKVTEIALRAAAGHEFALGGGISLIAHGITSRPTKDIDLFTNRDGAVAAAADAVEATLREEGFQVERVERFGDLAEVWEGLTDDLAEWIVTEPGGSGVMLQMANVDRARDPVTMSFGPVLHVEDAVGRKVVALAERAEVRDYVDVAAALARYAPDQLIGFARRTEPGLTDRELADAGRRLDQLGDGEFTRYGLSQPDVAARRKRFAAWPRT